jgi:site-specific DNA recombinase
MNAIIYTRTSTGEQLLGHEAQEAECRAHLSRLGITSATVYSDTISGSVPPVERDGFSAALDALKKSDVLIMWRRDRLGRALLSNSLAEQTIVARGARLITLDVTVENSDEAGLIKSMLDSFAEYERKLVRRRTAAALAARAAKGLVTGNTRLGHTATEEGAVIDDPDEAAKIARVCAKRAEGLTLRELRAWCAEHMITTRGGSIPSLPTIARWCENVERGVCAPRPRKPASLSKPTVEVSRPGLAATCADLKEKGLTLREIAVELEKRGFTNSKGRPFSYVQVHRILNRPKK